MRYRKHDVHRSLLSILGAAFLVLSVGACHRAEAVDRGDEAQLPIVEWRGAESFERPSEEVLRQQLTPMQFEVTQKDGTEPPFKNAYWDHEKAGIYVDVVSGEPLFSSTDKYKSGTGWPSFTRPIPGVEITETTDYKIGYPRTEVRSKHADSHLGHVFEDGPAPTGRRYCINSAALQFIPADQLEAEGYGEFLRLFE